MNCSGKKEESNIDPNGTATIKITDIHKKEVSHPNIDLVYLKANPYKEIGMVMKVITLQDRYIVSDKMKGNAVFIYDLDGNYISHIHRPGQGPGEYRNIENIYFNEVTNELVLYPMDGRKKYFFDLEGNFLREEIMEHSVKYADLVYFGTEELVRNHSHMDRGNNLVLINEGEIETGFIPFEEDWDYTPVNKDNSLAIGKDNTVLFSSGIRDTLYLYDHMDKTILPKYIIDFDKRKIDLDHFEFGDKVDGEEEKFIGLYNIFQNDRILSFSSFTQDDIVVFFYDKKAHKLYTGKQVLKNVVANAQVRFIVGMTNDGRFIGVIEPDKAEPLVFKNHKKLQKTYDGFNISDPDDKLLLIFDFEPK